MKSSQSIRMLSGIAALTLLLTVFQNCGGETGLGQMKSSNQRKGNGEGYGGKVTRYANKALECLDKSETAILEQKETEFFLIREACKNIDPVKLSAGEVDQMLHSNIALYDGRVFKEILSPGRDTTSDGETPEPTDGAPLGRTLVSHRFCRGSASTVYPRQIVDIDVDLDTNFDSKSKVTLANYASSSQLAGNKTEFSVSSHAVISSPGGIVTENYSGSGLAAGESYNLKITQSQDALVDGSGEAFTSFWCPGEALWPSGPMLHRSGKAEPRGPYVRTEYYWYLYRHI